MPHHPSTDEVLQLLFLLTTGTTRVISAKQEHPNRNSKIYFVVTCYLSTTLERKLKAQTCFRTPQGEKRVKAQDPSFEPHGAKVKGNHGASFSLSFQHHH